MKEKAAREVSFVELCIEERRAKLSDHFLYKIKECVDWERLRKTIRKGYKKNKNATGNPAYASVLFSDVIDNALRAPAP